MALDQDFGSVKATVASLALPDHMMRKNTDVTWEVTEEPLLGKIAVELWDTPRQEENGFLRKSILPSSNVVVLLFSMIDRASLRSITEGPNSLVYEIKDALDTDFDSIILVGTKHDLWLKQQKSNSEGSAEGVTREDCYDVRFLQSSNSTALRIAIAVTFPWAGYCSCAEPLLWCSWLRIFA